MTVSGTERSALHLSTSKRTHTHAYEERLCYNLPLVVVVIFVWFDFFSLYCCHLTLCVCGVLLLLCKTIVLFVCEIENEKNSKEKRMNCECASGFTTISLFIHLNVYSTETSCIAVLNLVIAIRLLHRASPHLSVCMCACGFFSCLCSF